VRVGASFAARLAVMPHFRFGQALVVRSPRVLVFTSIRQARAHAQAIRELSAATREQSHRLRDEAAQLRAERTRPVVAIPPVTSEAADPTHQGLRLLS